jgi:hypothetical protein
MLESNLRFEDQDCSQVALPNSSKFPLTIERPRKSAEAIGSVEHAKKKTGLPLLAKRLIGRLEAAGCVTISLIIF